MKEDKPCPAISSSISHSILPNVHVPDVWNVPGREKEEKNVINQHVVYPLERLTEHCWKKIQFFQ